jgi:demethylmenaquinone methyltransferase/2-methoxy-6-polyprenyl-1,4-benzoquinol methylase
MAVLDVGVGTGAVARAAVRVAGAGSRVVGLDPSGGMLRQALRAGPLALVQGRAEALPFQDACFDFVTIGYALRYVGDLAGAFAECRRVLRPGGVLLVLELTRPRRRAGDRLVRFYLDTWVPWVARARWGRLRTRAFLDACWGAIDRGVSPAAVDAALRAAGLEPFRSVSRAGLLREELARRPLEPSRGAPAPCADVAADRGPVRLAPR